MAEKTMKEANPDSANFAEWKAAEEHSNKRHEWLARIVHYDANSGIWIATAQDHYGESCLAGKFSVMNVNDKPAQGEAAVFFEKLYIKRPEGFPKQFFGGILLAPYDLSGSLGQFNQISYFGQAEWLDNAIKMRGRYQPLGLSDYYRGNWELEARIPEG